MDLYQIIFFAETVYRLIIFIRNKFYSHFEHWKLDKVLDIKEWVIVLKTMLFS